MWRRFPTVALLLNKQTVLQTMTTAETSGCLWLLLLPLLLLLRYCYYSYC